MNNRENIQDYVNNFRRRFAPFLKPGMGMRCNIYPSNQPGAILEFMLGRREQNDDIYNDIEESVNAALGKVSQKAFGGNLASFRFEGTNTILEPNRIILIKGGDSRGEWNDEGAKSDVEMILRGLRVIEK